MHPRANVRSEEITIQNLEDFPGIGGRFLTRALLNQDRLMAGVLNAISGQWLPLNARTDRAIVWRS
jgi:hypothetical protein